MMLNVKYWSGAGKLVYCFFDICTALLMRNILSKTTKLTNNKILYLLSFWLFNPILIFTTVQGYEISLKAMLIMFIICLLIHRKISFAGIFLGMLIHIDINLVIWILSIAIWIDFRRKKKLTHDKIKFIFFTILSFLLFVWFFYMQYGY